MATADTSPQVIEDVLFDELAKLGPDRADIRREATLEELDVDSLDVVELAQVVEDRWGIQFDPQDFKDVKTVGDAIDLVLSRMQ